MLVRQDRERVERRTIEDDSVEVLEAPEATLRLPSLDFSMTLADLYG